MTPEISCFTNLELRMKIDQIMSKFNKYSDLDVHNYKNMY
ncbi:hypothetical protein Mucpa_0695 [Mucilaginibacter paludis DSM 18603]|uniref:Uncharacterized protein n=1 Tax=Mucilaginibacter paludis DSM 18603 TaxID=714943 RepID=H1Y6C8_9SPHI|nr:hypothetical protein Mucpa_0695 [Mucilaginibacter paludis DSM 18603]